MDERERTDKDYVELLLARVEELRQAQRMYFKHRDDVHKRKSIDLETGLDELCRQFRRLGYDPEKYKSNTEQNKLF